MRGGPCNPGLEPQMAGLVEPWVRSSWVCYEYLQRGGFVDTLVCQLPVDSRAAPCVGESTLRCPPPRRARRARTHMADVDARAFRKNKILNLIRVSYALLQSTERKSFTYKRR